MKRKSLLAFFTITLAILIGCSVDQLPNNLDLALQKRLSDLAPTKSYDYFILPESSELSAIPQDPANPLTVEKVELGKLLFFETALAREAVYQQGMGTYSCATCHVPSAGFMPGRVQGIADGGFGFGLNGEDRDQMQNYQENELDVQGARPLSMLNVAYVTNSTWSGKFGATHANADTKDVWGLTDPLTVINHLGLQGLEAQNMEGLDLHRMVVDEYVLDTLGYRALYDLAFPDFSGAERYSKMTTSFAISAYIRSLLTNKAPFQQWLKGDELAMNEQEKRGALLFYDEAGCYRCHKGPSMSATEFHALGVKDLYEAGGLNTGPNDMRNFGRGAFTGRAEDMFKFKVPQIYNMADSPFYFHGSSKRSLLELVEYFNAGEKENEMVPDSLISPFFHPLRLTDEQVQDLLAFLEHGLRDPELQRYVPNGILSGQCFPNNDPESREDLGCE